METILEAKATNYNSSLQITTTNRGVVWLDQVSAMPLDTYKVRTIVFNAFFSLKKKNFFTIVFFFKVHHIILHLAQGHGFRKDLFQMVADLKPKFFRFPGIYV